MISIGIVSVQADPASIGPENRYWAAILRAGARPHWLPWSEDPGDWASWAAELDGFLFPGGGDMDPKYYGQAPIPACGDPSPRRDVMELGLLREIEARGKPVLGICRGFQTMNVARGGTLLQDIPWGGHSDDAGRYRPSHPAVVLPGTLLGQLLGTGEILTNSVHHQALDRLGRGLRVSAKSPDGIIEGVEDPSGPLFLGVQFHPEATAGEDPRMQAIFDCLVRRAADTKEKTKE